MAVRTLPRDPPGEGGAKNKIKNHFKHSQVPISLDYITQSPEKHTNTKEYFPETGFDVLPAVPGRRATSHD